MALHFAATLHPWSVPCALRRHCSPLQWSGPGHIIAGLGLQFLHKVGSWLQDPIIVAVVVVFVTVAVVLVVVGAVVLLLFFVSIFCLCTRQLILVKTPRAELN
ncbi:unnamed protein product [Polarella glacialis]|uniref:Uncharacterized protein n=1 Tax=Polarella glacialis TaxID=89957 RepID=A0A813GYB3_POLGL|nr:unnamed protein product [Polarella glacialis]